MESTVDIERNSIKLLKSLVFYEWKIAQLGSRSDTRANAERQVYRHLADQRRSTLSARLDT